MMPKKMKKKTKNIAKRIPGYHIVSGCGMVLELQTLIKNDKRSHTKDSHQYHLN